MAEYIERGKALEQFDKWIDSTAALPIGTSYYYECRGCIECVPAADVAPVAHGSWVVLDYTDEDRILVECSVCKECTILYRRSYPSYCPGCGAKMDKEGK